MFLILTGQLVSYTPSLRRNCFTFDARDISRGYFPSITGSELIAPPPPPTHIHTARELVHVPVGLCFYPSLSHLTIYPLRTAILGKL